MAPIGDGNLRAKASSEDIEGVKYIHLQRVKRSTGDTRRCPWRCPRPPADAYDWHCISHVGHGELRTLGIGHKLLILCDLWTSIRAQFASTSST